MGQADLLVVAAVAGHPVSRLRTTGEGVSWRGTTFRESRTIMETPLRLRNTLLRAFVINLAVIILAWLFTLSGLVTTLMAMFFNFLPAETHLYMAYLLGIWKILNVTLFLVPALAIHWEYGRGK
ncbi:MAG: hypothetical protein LBE86_08010 [Gemmobacter sp.]|nr:hypothetical protein [Gemmobacter sp.]